VTANQRFKVTVLLKGTSFNDVEWPDFFENSYGAR